jgi:hypothetical protein
MGRGARISECAGASLGSIPALVPAPSETLSPVLGIETRGSQRCEAKEAAVVSHICQRRADVGHPVTTFSVQRSAFRKTELRAQGTNEGFEVFGRAGDGDELVWADFFSTAAV